MDPRVQQLLFTSKCQTGEIVSFAILTDGSCAILRNGEVAAVFDSDPASIDLAVGEFRTLGRKPSPVEPQPSK